jgi:branched-chain amino acid transport system ATP-binding protein
MLTIHRLFKRFTGLIAINDLSFEVRQGEMLGLIGPNGAGKTTVFNLISGFIPPTSGEILFKGKNIIYRKPHAISALGLVRTFQTSILFEKETVFSNVIAGHHLHWRTNFFESFLNTSSCRKEKLQVVASTEKILESMGLAEVRNQVAGELPHGLQRMLGVSIALAANPELLLLDEPITGMTHIEAKAMMNSIKRLNGEGLSILLVEHHLKHVMETCDRIIVLNFGTRIAEGTPKEISENDEVIKAYLGEPRKC